MGRETLAVLLTCYNRKDKTVNCINKLLPQLERLNLEYKIYICDDRSTDGTYECLKEMLPTHAVFQSSGNLYWCKGMHRVMKDAVADACDYYLMVNDDVDFFDNALQIMFHSYQEADGSCGIVGTTKAISSENFTYGGRDRNKNFVLPEGKEKECFWANWNCFLIDKNVVENVGIIDGKYQHGGGDYDYSYRMWKAGYKIYVARDCVGRCDVNSIEGSFRDKNVKRTVRLKKMFSPKGLPFYSFMRYHMRIGGKRHILLYLYGYLSNIGYILLRKDIK
ncbi:MAG: glycosyltransferase family 2 protein [Lachnospiraceae bacterium]|nr:glycosyltransferase family 2 protein [Lachnospiraceae bacterium]